MNKADKRDFDAHYEDKRDWCEIPDEAKRICNNCKYFEPEVHYSGGEKGWCFLAGEILGIDVEWDDTCEDWRNKND